MKRSMLRMPSKDCQAGKGELGPELSARIVPKRDRKHKLQNQPSAVRPDLIENIGSYSQVLVVPTYR